MADPKAPVVANDVTMTMSRDDFLLLTRFVLDADVPEGFSEASSERLDVIYGAMDAVAVTIDPTYHEETN